MNAGGLAAAMGLDPERLAASVGVEPARIPVRAAPRWLERLWIGEVGAMTLPWAIYVRPRLLRGDLSRLAGLLVHELVHAGQWRSLGPAAFLIRYLTDYVKGRQRGLSHRASYHDIALEREARRLSRELLGPDR